MLVGVDAISEWRQTRPRDEKTTMNPRQRRQYDAAMALLSRMDATSVCVVAIATLDTLMVDSEDGMHPARAQWQELLATCDRAKAAIDPSLGAGRRPIVDAESSRARATQPRGL